MALKMSMKPIVKYLVEHEADCTRKLWCFNRGTCTNGHKAIIEYLVETGNGCWKMINGAIDFIKLFLVTEVF